MAARASGLQTHIWNNNFKSMMLLAFYPILILVIVWACAAAFGMMSSPVASGEQALNLAAGVIGKYWPMITAGVGGWFGVAWMFHTKMVRSMANSHPVTRKDEPELYNLLENLCITKGMPVPRLEIIESHSRNAFASGVDTKSFCVTVTRGLMQSLAKDELEGVIAHELSHIQNRDVRLLIITIIFTGMIGFAAQVMWRNMRYGMMAPRSSRGQNGNNKGGGRAMLFALLVILWVGYFATLFTRFAISRKREFMADAGAVQMTKNPEAMMRALMRISGKDQIPKIPADISMMCIENSMPFMGLFATHPPIEKRIKALSQTSGAPIPHLPTLKPFEEMTRADLSLPAAPKDKQFSPWDHKRSNWTTRTRFKHRREANPWKS